MLVAENRDTASAFDINQYLDPPDERTYLVHTLAARTTHVPSLAARFPEIDNAYFVQTFLYSPWLGGEFGDVDTKSYQHSLRVASFAVPAEGEDANRALENLDDAFLITTGKGVSAALSAGYVAWILRAGSLLTGVASTIPAWRGFDPLPVIAAQAGNANPDPTTKKPDDPNTPLEERWFDVPSQTGD